jgi:hypothetical protein
MPEPLGYSRPLYVGRQQFRSPLGIFGAVSVSVMGLVFVCAFATYGDRMPIVFLIFGICFICLGGWLWYKIAYDQYRWYAVEAEGIVENGNLVPWSRIVRFGAYVPGLFQGSKMMLFYRAKPFTFFSHGLFSTHGISDEEYRRLIADLERELGDEYPDLKVGGYEKMPSGGGGGA